MMSKLKPFLALCSFQRLVAGLVFIPLMAYSFAPFQDMTLSFSQRLLFWSGVMLLALAVTWASGKLVRDWLERSRVLIRDFVFALLILTLFAPSLWALTWIVFALNGLMAPGLLVIAPYGILFAAGLLLVRQSDQSAIPQENPKPRLCKRLPATFTGQIFRLTSRDHHVDVVTSEGLFSIRSRFGDAIAEMDSVTGHCTHRSHWVVDAAIAGSGKENGKTYLRLRNGDQVPVSRKYKPMLEAAGVL
ncbi:response regulator receiver protein [Rhodobacteraceae bacterium KLH11]|nr:response regulator receiver protein [Rhodobacteraceae bacterium KLH11]